MNHFKTTLGALGLCLIVTSCQENKLQTFQSDSPVLASNLVVETKKTWKVGKTLTVAFLDGEEWQKDEVIQIANEWTVYANINFDFHKNIETLPVTKTVHIKVTFKGNKNKSYVGEDSHSFFRGKKAPSLWLGTIKDNPPASRKGTILHEFGHALGLRHEHQNSLRDFKFDIEAMKKHCLEKWGRSEAECYDDVINKFDDDKIVSVSYDPHSVMHYDLHPGLTDKNKKYGHSNHLSLLDKIEIANVYPGRKTKEEIVIMHEEEIYQLKLVEHYKNCQIIETERAGKTKYSFIGLNGLDFSYPYSSEIKADAVANMQGHEYCNFTIDEILEYRRKKREQEDKERSFGQCVVLDKSMGVNVGIDCKDEYPFFIALKDRSKSVEGYCFPTFGSAVYSMKRDDFCKMTDQDVIEHRIKEEADFQNSRAWGKCYIAKTPETEMTGYVRYTCPESYPHFIVDSSKSDIVEKGCHKNWRFVLKKMKAHPKCQ